MAALVNNLGGERGFGENYLDRNDDGYTDAIDITSVFPDGINLFGQTYNYIYINNNGNITFDYGLYQYTPGAIDAGSRPIIAPFWGDVDTRGGEVAPGSGNVTEPPHDLGTYQNYLSTLPNSEEAMDEYYEEMTALANLSNASLDSYHLNSYYDFVDQAVEDGLLTSEESETYDFTNYYNFLLQQYDTYHSGYDPNGTSTGSNLVWYDLAPESGIITITWDDVGYYDTHTDKTNAFQLQLINTGDGNFDMIFRYEDINWVTGDASGGYNGIGGTVARAGYSAGDGEHYFELPMSGNEAAMLGLEEFRISSTDEAGVIRLSTDNGNFEGIGLENHDDLLTGGDGSEYLDGRSGNDVLFGEGGEDTLAGGDGDDFLDGGSCDDLFYPGNGNDTIVGGQGYDVVSFGVGYNEALVQLQDGVLVVNGEGSDQLYDVERLQFDDVELDPETALTLRDTEAEVVRLYSGVFDRLPDNSGLEYWVADRVSHGHSIQEVAALFAGSDEFSARFGAEDNREFINLLYNNILNRDADEAGFAYWEQEIAQTGDRSGMVVSFINSDEYIENTEETVNTVLSTVRLENLSLVGTEDSGGMCVFPDTETPSQLMDETEIFDRQGDGDFDLGVVRTLADFSKAVYDLQPWELSSEYDNRSINMVKANASEAHDYVLSQGWQPVDLNPEIEDGHVIASSVFADYSDVITANRMENGFYTNGNAAAFVARSDDALVVAFRGTNDNNNDDSPDVRDWVAKSNHYDLLKPLVEKIDEYVRDEGIEDVYVTGHSLGGAMALAFMDEHQDGDYGAEYHSYTFAAPGYDAFDITDDDVRITNIMMTDDVVPRLGATEGKDIEFTGKSDQLFEYVTNHDMDYYRLVVDTVDADLWNRVEMSSGDLDILIDGEYEDGGYFVVDGYMSGSNPPEYIGTSDSVLKDEDLLEDYDIIYGGKGNDEVYGTTDNNEEILMGAEGNDKLYIGKGDTAIGGVGRDDFYIKLTETPVMIEDFESGEDRIIVTTADEPGALQVIDENHFVSYGDNYTSMVETFPANTYLYDVSDGTLKLDMNGTEEGGQSLLAVLSGAPELNSDDIFVA